jgi:hypothetical protein
MQNNVVEKLNLKKQNKNGIFLSGSLHAVNIPRFENRALESIVTCVYKVCTNRRQVTQDLQFIENQQQAREKFSFHKQKTKFTQQYECGGKNNQYFIHIGNERWACDRVHCVYFLSI